MRHSFIIFTLGLGLTQLTACRSNAKLDASASITVEEVSSNGIPGILIALNLGTTQIALGPATTSHLNAATGQGR